MTGKTVGDGIDKYLEKVFGNFPPPTQADAERWQEKLGVSVSLDDVDLIYTFEAIASDDQTLFDWNSVDTKYRSKTRLFLGAIEDMRFEMERRLRRSVDDLIVSGVPDYEAVRKTLLRTLDTDSLRREVISAAVEYCRQKTLERARAGKSLAVGEDENFGQPAGYRPLAYYLLYSFFVVPLITLHIFTLRVGLVAMFVVGGIALLAGIGVSYFRPSFIPKETLLEDFARFLSRPPLPNATARQKYWRFIFRFTLAPPSITLFSLSFVYYVIMAIIVVCLYHTHFRNDMLLLLVCVIAGSYLGKRIWCRLRWKEVRVA